jgi:hypothetical protein
MSYAMRRRSFLSGLGAVGAATGLGWWLRRAESWAGGAAAPKRLLVIQRPNGTVTDRWVSGGAFGPVLAPFMDLQPQMVVPTGLRIATANGGNATHEGGLVTIMTGSPIGEARPPSPDDWRNTAPSIDQILAAQSPVLSGTTPFASLQIAAHNRQDGAPEVANRALSYTDADAPLYPEVSPTLTYERLFGGLTPGLDAAELERVRAKNQSVLDFIGGDLERLEQLAPASERPKLEAHAGAIRDLESSLNGLTSCTPGESPGDFPDSDHFTNVAAVGEAQLAILRTAFTCDATRVATFMWTPGASAVQFEGLFDGMPLVQHHSLSHQNLSASEVTEMMAAIDTWYSERTAEFLRTLRDTQDFDGSGSILDNTLVLYFSEVAVGWTHAFDDLPVALFGGANVGLQGGPVASYPGRSTNDLWLSIASAFGVELGSLGAEGQSTGPLEGLFA